MPTDEPSVCPECGLPAPRHTMTCNTYPDALLYDEPRSSWRPGRPMKPRRSVAHTIDGARTMIRSASRRPVADLPDLANLGRLAADVEAAMATMVATLRDGDHGASWADIGRALGITRQAAQQRFGAPVPE